MSRGSQSRVPLNFKLPLLPGHFRLLMPENYKTNKRVTTLTEVIGPDHQEEGGLLQHNEGTEEYVWHLGDWVPLGMLMGFSGFAVNGQIQQPYSTERHGKQGLRPLGGRVWVVIPGNSAVPD